MTNEYTEYQQERGHVQIQDIDPVPVHITSSGATPVRDVQPEFATCFTFSVDTLTNMGQPIRLLSRRYRRDCAKIIIGSTGPIGAGVSAQGQQTAPAANTQICLIAASSVKPGLYNIEWTVSLAGTPGVNENDNFQLRLGASTLETSSNPGAVGEFPQETFGPVALDGTQGVAIRSGAAVGTAGAIYLATVTIVPVIPNNGSATVVLNSKQEHLMQPTPVGAQILAPIVFDWENQQPLYAVLTPASSGPVLVAVIDQAYEET
jgi:hypothetical protein